MLRAALLVLVAAVLALCGAAPSLAAVPPNPAPWPDQFTVHFKLSIPRVLALGLPSVLHYDWTNRRQAVIHEQCPIVTFTQCRMLFSPAGTFIIDEALGFCCKAADFGTFPPYMFSNFSTFNGTEVVNGLTTYKWNLFDHGDYFTDVASNAPVKFRADAGAAGIVWWDFQGPFRNKEPDEANFKLPAVCILKCPIDQPQVYMNDIWSRRQHV